MRPSLSVTNPPSLLRGLPGTGGNSSTILPTGALAAAAFFAAFSAAAAPPVSAHTDTTANHTPIDINFMGIPDP